MMVVAEKRKNILYLPHPPTKVSLNPPLVCLRRVSVCIQGGDPLKQHMLMFFKMFISE